MSKSVNRVTLIGNIGNDPEIRSTNSGMKVAQFSVATTRSWKNSSGEKQEKTEWHKCVAWGSPKGTGLADIVESYVKKGDKIYVEGQLEYRSYEDKDKQTKYVTEIKVQEIVLLGGKRDAGSTGASSAASAQKVRQPAAVGARSNDFEEFPSALDDEGDDSLPF